MRKILPPAFWACLFLAFFTPMELGDVWWHLSTGRWIWEHGSLPMSDPFSSTGAAGGAEFVLKGFWLYQLVLYGIERAAGVFGVVALKAALFTLAFFLLARTLKSYGAGDVATCLMVLPAAFIATHYDEARPQTATFLLFALTLHIIETGRSGIAGGGLPRSLLLLPVVMLIWSNVHPGFVIGDLMIAAYTVLFLLRAALRRGSLRETLLFSAVCLAAVAISALNPNGLEAALRTKDMLLTSMAGTTVIHEHMPVKEFASFTRQGYLQPAIVTVTVAGGLSFAVRLRRADVFHLVVFIALAYLSAKTFRAGLFFAIFATASMGKNLAHYLPRLPSLEGRAAKTAMFAMLLLIASILLPRSVIKAPVMDGNIFPVKASAFVEGNRLPGNLFHPYEWGGYITWRLYPAGYKVFIDGRAIGPMDEYADVLAATPRWREILERRGINTVLYWPLLPYEGRVPPLLFALLGDEGWVPVYWDLQSVVFVRKGMARGRVISKAAVWELFTSLISANIEAAPGVAGNYTALGEVYLEQGLRQDAKRAFERALSIDPADKAASFWLRAAGRD